VKIVQTAVLHRAEDRETLPSSADADSDMMSILRVHWEDYSETQMPAASFWCCSNSVYDNLFLPKYI